MITLQVITPSNNPLSPFQTGTLVPVLRDSKKFWLIEEKIGEHCVERKVFKESNGWTLNGATFAPTCPQITPAKEKAVLGAIEKAIEPALKPAPAKKEKAPKVAPAKDLDAIVKELQDALLPEKMSVPQNIKNLLCEYSIVWNEKEISDEPARYAGQLESLVGSFQEDLTKANDRNLQVHKGYYDFEDTREYVEWLNDEFDNAKGTVETANETLKGVAERLKEVAATIDAIREWIRVNDRNESLDLPLLPLSDLTFLVAALPDNLVEAEELLVLTI